MQIQQERETVPDGTQSNEVAPGAAPERIMREVDDMFANGPQRVTTTTEAEFQRQFVSMIGGLPKFIAGIGTGVLFAIMLAALNTMLMASRERTPDLGILKALGFSDASASVLLLLESLLLCGAGGVVGVGLALLASPILGKVLSMILPNFTITGETVGLALGLSLLIGLLAGAIPAYRASRLRVVEALRSEA